jgi:DNA-binding transcriptional regulator YhcF (GntR family)
MVKQASESTGKRKKVMEWFLEEIRSGKLGVGDTVPTRYELAKRFDCSRATADFAVQSLIKERVLLASRGKGTFIRSSDNSQTVDAIALINCNHTFFWSSEIEQAFLTGIGLKSTVSRYLADDLKQPAEWEKCKRHRAVVLIMPQAEHESFLSDLRRNEIPHLVLYRDPPESSFINIDQRAAGRNMVKVLAEQGRNKIAWISVTENRYKTPEERYAGYLEGLLLEKLSFRLDWVKHIHCCQEEASLDDVFAAGDHPDAVIVGRAKIGFVIKSIQSAGLIPGIDVLIGCLDEQEPGMYPFPLLCAERLTRKIGLEAAQIIAKTPEIIEKGACQKYLVPEINRVDLQ